MDRVGEPIGAADAAPDPDGDERDEDDAVRQFGSLLLVAVLAGLVVQLALLGIADLVIRALESAGRL